MMIWWSGNITYYYLCSKQLFNVYVKIMHFWSNNIYLKYNYFVIMSVNFDNFSVFLDVNQVSNELKRIRF